jgi:poly-beta-hydroxyalkanoate depolymerase
LQDSAEQPVLLRAHSGDGHYGIISGRRFREMLYPRIRDFIRRHA